MQSVVSAMKRSARSKTSGTSPAKPVRTSIRVDSWSDEMKYDLEEARCELQDVGSARCEATYELYDVGCECRAIDSSVRVVASELVDVDSEVRGVRSEGQVVRSSFDEVGCEC